MLCITNLLSLQVAAGVAPSEHTAQLFSFIPHCLSQANLNVMQVMAVLKIIIEGTRVPLCVRAKFTKLFSLLPQILARLLQEESESSLRSVRRTFHCYLNNTHIIELYSVVSVKLYVSEHPSKTTRARHGNSLTHFFPSETGSHCAAQALLELSM